MADKVRVERIQVAGLFGLYDHEINLKQDDRVTILHGPNGVGKSVLLRLVAAYFAGRYQELIRTSFESLSIYLSDGSNVRITAQESDNSRQTAIDIRVQDSVRGEAAYTLLVTMDANRVAAQIERASPYLRSLGESTFYDTRYQQRLSSEEVVEKYGSPEELVAATSIQLESEPTIGKQMRSKVAVQLVETQRLLRTLPEGRFSSDAYYYPPTDRKPMVATVRSYSDDIVRQIARTLSVYGTESQKLDQTFPQRLIRYSSHLLSADELKTRLGALNDRHAELIKLGLIDKTFYYSPASSDEIEGLDETNRNVMSLYVSDTEEKLGFLGALAIRISLLVTSVNGKFRNKTLSVSREHGLQINDSRGRQVSIEALSSGEQHELVLWYDLLFKVGSNALVLIDEPELSLHVSWQKKFLPELLQIAKTVPFDAIIATHSPFIIGDRLDLTVPLDADVEE